MSSCSSLLPAPERPARGVRWAQSAFPGTRRLLAYDSHGELVLEARMREESADAETELAAWAWLDAHYPERRLGLV